MRRIQGARGHAIFASFSGVVIVVGGSGITFALSVVQDLIQKDLAGKSRVKVIDVIWSVQDAGTITFHGDCHSVRTNLL